MDPTYERYTNSLGLEVGCVKLEGFSLFATGRSSNIVYELVLTGSPRESTLRAGLMKSDVELSARLSSALRDALTVIAPRPAAAPEPAQALEPAPTTPGGVWTFDS